MKSLNEVLALARKNLGGEMESSARLCLQDAVRLQDDGNFEASRARALKSLVYSVGVFSPEYWKAF